MNLTLKIEPAIYARYYGYYLNALYSVSSYDIINKITFTCVFDVGGVNM